MELQEAAGRQKEWQEKVKYVFLNDTGGKMGIHQGSCVTKLVLAPGEKIIVEIPEGKIPWIKVWSKIVLLSYIDADNLKTKEG